MLCYEELCNQVYNVLHNIPIETNKDSWGHDNSLIFDGRYERIMITIVDNTTDTVLKLHCALVIAVLQIIKEYTNFND